MGEIVIARTWNVELIQDITAEVWENVTDDSRDEDPYSFVPPVEDDDARYYISAEDGQIVGLWMTHRRNHVLWQMHVTILPEFHRRGMAIPHSKLALPFAFQDTGALTIVAEAPGWNPRIAEHAEAAGFTRTGVIPQSYSKDGRIYDTIILTAHRKDHVNHATENA